MFLQDLCLTSMTRRTTGTHRQWTGYGRSPSRSHTNTMMYTTGPNTTQNIAAANVITHRFCRKELSMQWLNVL